MQSKALLDDEGRTLPHPARTGGGSRYSQLLHSAKRKDGSLWSFGARRFNQAFKHRLALLPGDTAATPFQVRHSASSCAMAIDRLTLAELSGRVRHNSPQTVSRYAQTIRYVAEMENVDETVAKWAAVVESLFSALLAPAASIPMPDLLSRGRLCHRPQ